MESLKIVLLCVVSAVVYGILHDQVTARVCVEYFTIGHAPMFDTTSPTLLAIGWGTVATWWMGVLLSGPAVAAARVGRLPKVDAVALIRPIGCLLALMACASLAAGIAGYCHASAEETTGRLAEILSRVPPEKRVAFLADLWAHRTAYAVGFFGGLGLCFWVLQERWQATIRNRAASSRGAD